jgi:hypothetical protein
MRKEIYVLSQVTKVNDGPHFRASVRCLYWPLQRVPPVSLQYPNASSL